MNLNPRVLAPEQEKKSTDFGCQNKREPFCDGDCISLLYILIVPIIQVPAIPMSSLTFM